MPNIKVPTKYVKKLKELGVYDEWLKNVKDSWKCNDDNKLDSSVTLTDSKSYQSFETFMQSSFTWIKTTEGGSFWCRISEK